MAIRDNADAGRHIWAQLANSSDWNTDAAFRPGLPGHALEANDPAMWYELEDHIGARRIAGAH